MQDMHEMKYRTLVQIMSVSERKSEHTYQKRRRGFENAGYAEGKI